MSATWGILVLWVLALFAAHLDLTCDDIWGTSWWRTFVIIVVGYLAFSTIARHGVAW